MKKIRCNNCLTTYKETKDNQIYICKECNTDEYLMEDFIEKCHCAYHTSEGECTELPA